MPTTNDLYNGMVIEFKNDLYQVLEFQHVKPGKGQAFVRTKLKNLTTGAVIEHTFPAGVEVTPARVERRKAQYSYKDDMGYHFFDTETFEEYIIPEDQISGKEFLKEDMEVEVLYHDEKGAPIGVEVPPFVILEVTYTEPGLKGDTATNATKPAKLETGIEIQVPLFVEMGDKVKVDTRTKRYVERIREKKK
ncbi:MAG: elongation factor P [Chlorobi bacterium]|nr:elongation factor P [Chlorobiota bacterium]